LRQRRPLFLPARPPAPPPGALSLAVSLVNLRPARIGCLSRYQARDCGLCVVTRA